MQAALLQLGFEAMFFTRLGSVGALIIIKPTPDKNNKNNVTTKITIQVFR